MLVREARMGDIGRIVVLFGQLGYATTTDIVARQFKVMQGHGSGQAFVAEQGDDVFGIAVVHVLAPLHVDRQWALLSALVVDASARSLGMGAALLAAAERYAMDHGCSQLELSSSVARTRAHAFYERHGYLEKRRRFVKSLP